MSNILVTNDNVFGVCVQTTLTVRELISCARVKEIEVNLNDEIEGDNREAHKNHVKMIKQYLLDNPSYGEPPKCPFPLPIVVNVDTKFNMKSTPEKFKNELTNNWLDILEGGHRYRSLLLVKQQLQNEEKHELLDAFLKMPVKMCIYFELSDSLKKLLFLCVNFNVKKVPNALNELFLQQIYKDDPRYLSKKQLHLGRMAAIAFNLSTANKLFARRVSGISEQDAIGPSYHSLVMGVKKLYEQTDLKWLLDHDDDALMSIMSESWKALASAWYDLTDQEIWVTLSHNTAVEIGFTIIHQLLINQLDETDEDPRLNLKQAKEFCKAVMPKISEMLKIKQNPHICTTYNGSADDYASAAARGKLRRFVVECITTQLQKPLKLAA